jgi:hypothetical protein
MKRLAILVILSLMVRGASGAWAGQTGSSDRPERAQSSVDATVQSDSASARPFGPWRVLLRAAAAAGVAVVLAWGVALIFENRFVYHPGAGPAVSWDAKRIGARKCRFTTEDKLELSAWWHPGVRSLRTEDGPVLLWCHGNAGSLTHRAENLQLLASRGLAALLFDYRGYGKSDGKPSEQGLYRDAAAAYRYLTEERGVEPWRVICFGRSLGAAVALRTALEKPTAGLVMESAFESVPAMARKMWVFAPIAPFARNRYDNLSRVRELGVPLLMVHGSRDSLVPIEQGRRVFEAAPEPKEFCVVPGAGHNDLYSVGGEDYFDTLEQFCRRCVREAAP